MYIENMYKKRGQFFTIDAILAAGILLLVILLVSRSYISEPDKTQVSSMSQDTVRVFTNLKVNDLDNDYVKSLIDTQVITKENNTFLEQIGEFWAEGNIELAKNFTKNVTDILIPARFGLGVYVDGEEIYSRNKAVTRNLISSRKIISGIEKDKPTEGFTSKVVLTGIKSKTTNAYSYFGGYEGDGNLIKRLILPDDVISIVNATLEVDTGGDFDLYINKGYSGSYVKGSAGGGEMLADKFAINESYYGNLKNGTNFFTINFTSEKKFIAGGFLKVRYTTSEINDTVSDGSQTFWLPGIDGIINYYSSYYIPGTLNSMKIHLDFFSNYLTFLRIGNTTVYSNITNGSTTVDLDNSTLESIFTSNGVNYNDLSLKTVPIRLGLDLNGSILGGDVDVILITDVSGSMNWRLDNDGVTGVSRNCDDPNLYNSDTRRISLAMCLDKQFVDVVLNNSQGDTTNRIGLIAYSGVPNYFGTSDSVTIVSTHSLSSDNASLKAEIDTYTASGATGICGAIRQARLMLEQESNESRKKFIVVMADGLANVECDSADEDDTVGCLSRECPNTGFCSANSCLYRVAEDVGSRSSPALGIDFNGSKRLVMISGESTGTFNGYYWNDTKWITDSSYVAGLPDVGSTSAPALAFNLTGDDRWTLIAGESTGEFNGFYWDGDQWVSDSSRVSGLGDVGSDSAPALAFNLTGDDTWTLIAGEDNGRFNGFYWDGDQWVSDSSRVSGLGDVGSDSSPLLVFNLTGDNSWMLISGLGDGRYYSYYWEDNSWFFMCRDFISDKAFDDAENDACKAFVDTQATIFSIGFGPVSKCPVAKSGLKTIAACGQGSYFASTSPNELQNIYNQIAQGILESTYSAQTINVSGGISTSLYSSSYIQLNYSTQELVFGKIPLGFETDRFNNNITTGILTIPENTTVFDAKVTSYSSDKWTDNLVVNGDTVYSLSEYNMNYSLLGDPYIVDIPVDNLNTGTNSLTISTGTSPTNSTGGSEDNRALYTLLVNGFSDFSAVVEKSDGCNWDIKFEDNSTDTIKVPSSYTGSDSCNYETAVYEQNDAMDISTYNLFRNLDIDKNGLLDVKISEENFDFDAVTVTNVPSLWGPAIVEIRVWR
jgi:hypothetical protein